MAPATHTRKLLILISRGNVAGNSEVIRREPRSRPTRCEGASDLVAESYLYSPAIDLTGMSEVTLTFWHNYNLTSGLDIGELGVSTNQSVSAASIPPLVSFTGEASGGWVQETVDLSGYAGQTIQVVWYYGGFSFSGTLDGWLVDDVSITGIVAARPNNPSMDSMRAWLARLEQGVARDDRSVIDSVLRDAVPDFRGEAA